MNNEYTYSRLHKIYLLLFVIVFIWSGIHPKDYFTWVLEVLPAILGLLVLLFTYKRFQFSNLVYGLLLLHCCILMVGGHYTYAEVPLFDSIKEVLNLSRNNYDKVGHLAQGFIPAMVAREILLRQNVVLNKKYLAVIIVSICLAISALYEIIEWFVAVLTGESSEAFLGTQGYVWDTQSDMLYAAIGAVFALLTLSQIHNRAIANMAK